MVQMLIHGLMDIFQKLWIFPVSIVIEAPDVEPWSASIL
jgi:hypothetical protein